MVKICKEHHSSFADFGIELSQSDIVVVPSSILHCRSIVEDSDQDRFPHEVLDEEA